jgi:hypothetical protein
MVNILCLKWGKRYPAYYVNELYRGVARNLKQPFRFVCATEDPSNLLPEIEVFDFPEDPQSKAKWPHIFMKLCILRDGFANLKGPTLFLDIDIIITGPLDKFFEYQPGKNCIIHNWLPPHKLLFRDRPDIGNSSVFRFEAGSSNYIYETYMEKKFEAENRSIYPTEQAFLTYAMKEKYFWPDEWVRSFKRHCRRVFPLNYLLAPKLPQESSIIAFHGQPDPDQAITGFKGKRIHHFNKAAPWIKRFWNPDSAK